MNLANWLYDKNRKYADGVAIFIHLDVDSDKNKYFRVSNPDKSRVDMLWRLLTNYARIHNIKPQKPAPPAAERTLRMPAVGLPVHSSTKQIQSKNPVVFSHPTIDYKELPDPLKQLWHDAAALNNELKSLHNKLKLISKDETKKIERAGLCQMIIEKQALIRSKYEPIDAWYQSGKKTLPDIPPSDEPFMSDLDKDKRIKANMNYIRRYFNDADKQDEVKLRRAELDKWGVKYEKLLAKITA